MQGHEHGSTHGAQQLRGPVGKHLRIIAGIHCYGQRNRGVQVRAGAAEGLRHQYTAEHTQRPAGGHNHPPGIGRVGLSKRYTGTNACAQ
jgi:hypothetical protein